MKLVRHYSAAFASRREWRYRSRSASAYDTRRHSSESWNPFPLRLYLATKVKMDPGFRRDDGRAAAG
jgi:hypothetical protein